MWSCWYKFMWMHLFECVGICDIFPQSGKIVGAKWQLHKEHVIKEKRKCQLLKAYQSSKHYSNSTKNKSSKEDKVVALPKSWDIKTRECSDSMILLGHQFTFGKATPDFFWAIETTHEFYLQDLEIIRAMRDVDYFRSLRMYITLECFAKIVYTM